jgi:transcriptional regulator GlxA family with amidase domain
LGSLEGTRQLFMQLNSFFKERGEPPIFKVQLVALFKETQITGDLYTIHSDRLLKDFTKTALIVIPALDGDLKDAIEINRDFVHWIIEQYESGAEVASLCMGAFLLASAGLLKGRRCATHWMAANAFRKMLPQCEPSDKADSYR